MSHVLCHVGSVAPDNPAFAFSLFPLKSRLSGSPLQRRSARTDSARLRLLEVLQFSQKWIGFTVQDSNRAFPPKNNSKYCSQGT